MATTNYPYGLTSKGLDVATLALSGQTVKNSPYYSNVLTRIQFGRMGTFNNTTANTFQITVAIQGKPTHIRPIFANTSSTASDLVAPCKVSFTSTEADLNNSSGTWTSITQNGAPVFLTKLAVGGGSGQRTMYTTTDWTPVTAVDRTDGGSYYLAVIRAQFASNSALPVYGNGSTDDFSNWVSKPDDLIFVSRNAAGDYVTDPTTWPTSGAGITNTSQSPIVGVQCLIEGKVITIGCGGDSICDGFGSTYKGESFIMKIAESLDDPTSTRVVYSNFGWSGQRSDGATGFHQRLIDMVESSVKPNILVFESGSLNDGEPLTTTIVNNWRINTQLVVKKCIENGVIPVVTTVMPCTYAAHALGSTDSMRLAHNAAILSYYNARGILCVDTATPFAGNTESHGQQEPRTDLVDALGAHPNDLGCTVIAAAIKDKISGVLGL